MEKMTYKIFYGWWIVAVAHINLLLGCGVVVYTFSVFFKPLLTEFGSSRASIALAYSAFGLASGLASPLMGRAVDRYGPRWVMVPGGIILGLCYVWLYNLGAIWQLWTIYLVIGVGFAAIGTVPLTRVLYQWFIKKRGRATGFAQAGVGMGGLIMAPLASYLISEFGWRVAYLWLGIIILAVSVPTIAFFMQSRPEGIGFLPDGEGLQEKKEVTEKGGSLEGKPFTAKMALHTFRFWMIAIAYFLYSMGFMGIFVHLVPFATDIGINTRAAAAILGFTTGVGILGKVSIGFLAERFNKEKVLILSFITMAIALILLMVIKSIVTLYWFVLLFGLGYCGAIVLVPLLSVEYFGLRSSGEIYGYLTLFFIFGTILGSLVAGYIFDITKSYSWAFGIFTAGFILAAAAVFACQVIKPKIT